MNELNKRIKEEIINEKNRLKEKKNKTKDTNEKKILNAKIEGLTIGGQIVQDLLLNYEIIGG